MDHVLNLLVDHVLNLLVDRLQILEGENHLERQILEGQNVHFYCFLYGQNLNGQNLDGEKILIAFHVVFLIWRSLLMRFFQFIDI